MKNFYKNLQKMQFRAFIAFLAIFPMINVCGKNLELSIEKISWSEYITHFKGIGIDSSSFRNFKENLAHILKYNEKNPKNILGISPMLHLSREQFEMNFEENSQTGSQSFSYEPSIFNGLFSGMINGKYYNWKDKKMIVVSDSYDGKPNSWIYTAKSIIESLYMIRYDSIIDLDIINIRKCADNFYKSNIGFSKLYSFLEYSGVNSILLSSYKRVNSNCLVDESHSVSEIERIKVVTSESIYFGPIIVEMDLNFDSIRYYQSSNNLQSSKILLLESMNKIPNYSALIVGFGRELDTNYFIIQTFLGNSWGFEGTFKLDVNSNSIKSIYSI